MKTEPDCAYLRCTQTQRLAQTTRKHFIISDFIYSSCHLPHYFLIETKQFYWSQCCPSDCAAAHQNGAGGEKAHSAHSFKLGGRVCGPFTGCGKLEIKRLPFTLPPPCSPSPLPSLPSLLLSLRPAFPAHVIVWMVCSFFSPPLPRPPLPLLQLTVFIPWKCYAIL